MESPQDGGGDIAVVPSDRFFFPGMPGRGNTPLKALVRYPDGKDSGQLSMDLLVSRKATPGEKNVLQEKM